MLMKYPRKTFLSWYFFNLLGWVAGVSGGFNLATFYLFPLAESKLSPSIVYKLDNVIQLGFPLLVLIFCVGFAQWLKLIQWKVKFDIYKWVTANVKGTSIAFVIFFILSIFVGMFQRPILDFLYGNHTYSAQTPFILAFISVMLPLLGSIGTSVIVAIDIFNWEFEKSNITKEE